MVSAVFRLFFEAFDLNQAASLALRHPSDMTDGKPRPTTKPSRTDQALHVAEEYASDQRKILQKLLQKLRKMFN